MLLMKSSLKYMIKALSLSVIAFPFGVVQADELRLPDFANVAEAALSTHEEAMIGRQIMAQIRQANGVVDQPQLHDYLNEVGRKLLKAAGRSQTPFYFFWVADPSINAFALPGGVIGVNAGLLLSAKTEAELASVLAHEITHVTQRHIAQQKARQASQYWVNMATLILAGIVASQTNAGMPALGAAVGLSEASQLAYSRQFEEEADRIGMQLMQKAGYAVQGMPDFFETLQLQYQFQSGQRFGFLQTHPLTEKRLAEAQSRALSMKQGTVKHDDQTFHLAKAQMSVAMSTQPGTIVRNIMANQRDTERGLSPQAFAIETYTLGLAALANHDTQLVDQALRDTADHLGQTPEWHLLNAAQALNQGNAGQALTIYQKGQKRWPQSLAFALGEVDAYMYADQMAEADRRIREHLHRAPQSVQWWDRLSKANADRSPFWQHYAAGQAFFYEDRYEAALIQYRLASSLPAPDARQKLELQARLALAENKWHETKQASRP
jgi:predicted Zn-dependent protease